MNLPNVPHPRLITWEGRNLRVVTYMPITDEQAQKIAVHFLRNKRPTPKPGTTTDILWSGDQATLDLL